MNAYGPWQWKIDHWTRLELLGCLVLIDRDYGEPTCSSLQLWFSQGVDFDRFFALTALKWTSKVTPCEKLCCRTRKSRKSDKIWFWHLETNLFPIDLGPLWNGLGGDLPVLVNRSIFQNFDKSRFPSRWNKNFRKFTKNSKMVKTDFWRFVNTDKFLNMKCFALTILWLLYAEKLRNKRPLLTLQMFHFP